jgi:cytosine/adenosine deaminase-related metal-dependent hydrolase
MLVDSPQTKLLITARWVIPIDSAPIESGAVLIEEGKISRWGQAEQFNRNRANVDRIDLPDSAVLPGLVNSHTHFELSFLKDEVPYQGDFVDWVRRLSRQRAERKVDLARSIEQSCRESLLAGVTLIGDICYGHRAWPFLAEQSIRKTCYAEVFGITEAIESPLEYLQRCIDNTKEGDLLRLGLSPHAPYSAGQPLYQAAAGLAEKYDLPLTSHLSETEAELEFIDSAQGSWRTYLEELGKWDGSFNPLKKSPIRHLLDMNLANRPMLLAHVNYISDADLDALARTNHSVAFCPRAHRFFEHSDHRFREMIAKGINVCLGTDSLAGNDSLSILDEMRYLHKAHAELDPDIIFQMATINGGFALHWSDKTGSISPGKEADLIAIPLVKRNLNPLQDILNSSASPSHTFVRGRQVYPC